MAILMAEGFDDGVLRGGYGGDGTQVVISTANPRTGTRCARIQTESSNSNWYDSPAFTSLTSGRFYVAFSASALPTPGLWWPIFELWDSIGVANHLVLDLMASGKFRLCRGAASAGSYYYLNILSSGTFTLTPGSYVSLCLQWTIDNGAGAFNLYVNGNPVPDIAYTGDTLNTGFYGTGLNSVDFVRMGSLLFTHTSPFLTTLDFDDLVAQDNTGAAPENAFLGDVEVPYTFPDANGAAQAWTIGGSAPAATAWESVKEFPPDADVTLIKTTTVNDISRFSYGNIPTTTSPIYAVIPLLRAKKEAGGTRIVNATTTDGVNTLTGANCAISADYVSWQPTVWHRQQDGTTAWTAAQINASTFGPKLAV